MPSYIKDKPIKKIGILAGQGNLPKKLAQNCRKNDIEPFIIAFEGQTPKDIVQGFEHSWCNMGAAGKIFKTLKNHDIRDIVMIGGITRPALSQIKPDMKGAALLARMGMKAMGDNDLLEMLHDVFIEEGFAVHGAHEFMDDLLATEGALGKFKPSPKMRETIKRGIVTAREIGRLDIGQSVIVQQGMVIGVEGIEGTDALIRRCHGYLRHGEGGILVKISKPQQSRSLDLPTIGPETVLAASQSGLAGIIVEAQNTLFVDPEMMRDIADNNKIFIMAISVEDYIT
ncbi:MAG: LpxI family protein [Alphaproteobacteria bacterium]